MSRKNQAVFVAMSGGVDSSVAALLLQQQGYEVMGAFMRNWTQAVAGTATNQWQRDEADAQAVARTLDIPLYTFDFEREYTDRVVTSMLREYAAGRTPNPDVMCNKVIKFGLFLERALVLGADYIATGHYVRLRRKFSILNSQFSNTRARLENLDIESSLKIENCKLKIANDTNKDQSYFLWTLTQGQLKHCLFPIGDYTKAEVRELARQFGLPNADKPDSQGICFVGEVAVRDFLKEYLPVQPGRVLTAAGKVVGTHEGAAFYTIGQRRGVGSVGGGLPYYVVEKNLATNTLVVAEGADDPKLYRTELIAADVNWISGRASQLPFRCKARIRYRQPLQACRLGKSEIPAYAKDPAGRQNPKSETVNVMFQVPQRAITPGQSVVFYQGDSFDPAQDGEMLGGGVTC